MPISPKTSRNPPDVRPHWIWWRVAVRESAHREGQRGHHRIGVLRGLTGLQLLLGDSGPGLRQQASAQVGVLSEIRSSSVIGFLYESYLGGGKNTLGLNM